jgi:hypothetical protein
MNHLPCTPPRETKNNTEALKKLNDFMKVYDNFYSNILRTTELEEIEPVDIASNLDKYIGWIPGENDQQNQVLKMFDTTRENITKTLKSFNLLTKASLGLLIQMWINYGVDYDPENCADPNVALLKKNLDHFLMALKEMDQYFKIELCPPNCKLRVKLLGEDGTKVKEICSDTWARTWVRAVQQCLTGGLKPLTLNNDYEQKLLLKWLNEESKLPVYSSFWVGARKGNGTSYWWITNGKTIDYDLKWKENSILFNDCLSIVNFSPKDFIFDSSRPCNSRMPILCEIPN